MARLNLNDSVMDAIINFSGGNPGALNTLMELQKARENSFVIDLMTLDNMELYESKLYMLWNDCCNRDISKVIRILELYRINKITQKDIDARVKNVGYGKDFSDLINNEREEIENE